MAEGPSSSMEPRREPRGTPTRLPRCSIDAVRDDRRAPAAKSVPPGLLVPPPPNTLLDCFPTE